MPTSVQRITRTRTVTIPVRRVVRVTRIITIKPVKR